MELYALHRCIVKPRGRPVRLSFQLQMALSGLRRYLLQNLPQVRLP